jgi:hypothetical protein
MVYHLAMTEDSTPYRLSDNREPLGNERRISLALTRSEWIVLKIALNNEIDRQIQDGKYLASRIERLQQLRVRLRNDIE